MNDDLAHDGFQVSMRDIASEYIYMQPSKHFSWNSEVVACAERFNPDLIFMQIQTENILDIAVIKRLSEIGFVINWNGDIRDDVPKWMIEAGQFIQLTTFSNMDDVKKCRSLGVKSDYLEIGVNTDIYKIHNVQKQQPEIVAHFNDYGNMFPLSQYRRDLVYGLQMEFGNNFGVYGNFENAKGNFNKSQHEESLNYNRAKIAINCSHFNAERYSSDRLLRIMSSGTLALTHNFSGIEDVYQVGKHLVVFNDLNELISKCRHYLSNENERNEIALCGYEYVRDNFSFTMMAKNIIKLYNLYNKK
jgi:spore maturation protein CgeB